MGNVYLTTHSTYFIDSVGNIVSKVTQETEREMYGIHYV